MTTLSGGICDTLAFGPSAVYASSTSPSRRRTGKGLHRRQSSFISVGRAGFRRVSRREEAERANEFGTCRVRKPVVHWAGAARRLSGDVTESVTNPLQPCAIHVRRGPTARRTTNVTVA